MDELNLAEVNKLTSPLSTFLKLEVATMQDAESILALQKLAYVSEAEIYNDFDIDPLTQTLDAMHRDFRKQVFLKASVSGKIVGSVRGYLANSSNIK